MDPDRGLYLCYMAPVPPNALMPVNPLSPELKAELFYYEENRKYVEAEVQLLHRLSELGQMDRQWQQHSCDFAELDSVYFYWEPGFDAGRFLCPDMEGLQMPISKNGKPFYTKEQYEQARYNSNALEYARSQGYELIQENKWYKLKEHDSMVFTPDGRWFWNSRGLHGGALEFQMYYEGKTITEAVLTLAQDREWQAERPQIQRPAELVQRQPSERPGYSFQLPNRAENFKQMFYYLCNTRGLEKDVVLEMIRQNRLFQSVHKLPGGKTVGNATFVYLDPAGNPVGAYQRGMYDREGQPSYKRDVPGSDKRFGWLLASPFNPATEVRVFEAAIDAASDASLECMKNADAWKQEPIDRLSLEGLNYAVLQTYLQNHPDVQTVTLMLDGDVPGRKAAAEYCEKLKAQGMAVTDVTPPFGKDWNEVLQETRSMEAERINDNGPVPEPCPEM